MSPLFYLWFIVNKIRSIGVQKKLCTQPNRPPYQPLSRQDEPLTFIPPSSGTGVKQRSYIWDNTLGLLKHTFYLFPNLVVVYVI